MPAWMINVLFATQVIATDGLDMSIGIGTDPHIAPGRWNNEHLNSFADQLALDIATSGQTISKAFAASASHDPTIETVYIGQTAGHGQLLALVRDRLDHLPALSR